MCSSFANYKVNLTFRVTFDATVEGVETRNDTVFFNRTGDLHRFLVRMKNKIKKIEFGFTNPTVEGDDNSGDFVWLATVPASNLTNLLDSIK
jgi:hypothetical protein